MATNGSASTVTNHSSNGAGSVTHGNRFLPFTGHRESGGRDRNPKSLMSNRFII